MTYRVLYGDVLNGDVLTMASSDRQFDERVQSERFSTEHEALTRARELLEDDLSTVVAVCDRTGILLSGVRLQLRLGYACE